MSGDMPCACDIEALHRYSVKNNEDKDTKNVERGPPRFYKIDFSVKKESALDAFARTSVGNVHPKSTSETEAKCDFKWWIPCFFVGLTIVDMAIWSYFLMFENIIETLPICAENILGRLTQHAIYLIWIFVAGIGTLGWDHGIYIQILIVPIFKVSQIIRAVDILANIDSPNYYILLLIIVESSIYSIVSFVIFSYLASEQFWRPIRHLLITVFRGIISLFNRCKNYKRWCSKSMTEVQGDPHVMIGMNNVECAMAELRRVRDRQLAARNEVV